MDIPSFMPILGIKTRRMMNILKSSLLVCVLSLLFVSRLFAAGIAELDGHKRVRFAECFNRPSAQFLMMALDLPLGEIGTVPPSWATLPSETPEDLKNLEDTFVMANFDIIITGNKAYAESLRKRGLVKQPVSLWKERIILAGPAERLAAFSGLDAASALRKIFSEKGLYFSLLADEDVIEAEGALFKSAGIENRASYRGYVETTRDDLNALFQAGDEGAFLLVGEASFAQYAEAERLDPALVKIAPTDHFRHTYACLAENAGFRKIRAADAAKYMEWLQGASAAGIISDFSMGGTNPFVPSR
ncbi:MAG: substrate-binding domain-containing protein [Synergistaceae bacterium]|jgi:ABC-type tungstate transport system permease subunit|nr:substrate-binding domain-containing protein [Synergistaceae bacterium]